MATLDLRPEPVDLLVYAGDGVALNIAITDAGLFATLAGSTWAAHVRQTERDAEPALVLAVTEEAEGLSLSIPETTADLVANAREWQGVWDLQATPADGPPVTLVRGSFTVTKDVTR